ncbi:ArsR family transcriptional regulator [Dietzia sp. UCD-THP]|uniref:Transcriptional regulator n=1 Tax=Dietzia natronolimnaea TaxID=161920 RepID=A0A2A2WR76_9ACTN|nr:MULTISPECIES: transcriptional regulator [Dietzia]EYT62323.1 ArsR family transcriptional regulator [Dietzia sp. UCD-THP]PAY23474.1 transcriptional regulator [Dietzia natronolimnaea]
MSGSTGDAAGTDTAGGHAAAPDVPDGPDDSDGRAEGHARHRLDEVIHAPVRFSIVAALAGVDDAEFATIRDAVEVSDSTLSKQVAVLEKAGYLKVRKGYVGKRPRTWLALSREGRRAYGSHLEALRAIAGG